MGFDAIYRGVTLYDGSGSPADQGDLAIDGDRIAAVGTVTGAAPREVPC